MLTGPKSHCAAASTATPSATAAIIVAIAELRRRAGIGGDGGERERGPGERPRPRPRHGRRSSVGEPEQRELEAAAGRRRAARTATGVGPAALERREQRDRQQQRRGRAPRSAGGRRRAASSSSRCSSSTSPAVNSTAPAAMSGARCAGGRSSSNRSSRRLIRRRSLGRILDTSTGPGAAGIGGSAAGLSSITPSRTRGSQRGCGYAAGPCDHAAVLELEDGRVPRAGDAAVVQLALVERAAAVRAAVRERVHGALVPGDEHADAADLGEARLALGQLVVAQRRRPVLRRLLERRLVDADALRVAQVPAEVARTAPSRPAPREREQLARARAAPRLRAASEAPNSAVAPTLSAAWIEPDAADGARRRPRSRPTPSCRSRRSAR